MSTQSDVQSAAESQTNRTSRLDDSSSTPRLPPLSEEICRVGHMKRSEMTAHCTGRNCCIESEFQANLHRFYRGYKLFLDKIERGQANVSLQMYRAHKDLRKMRRRSREEKRTYYGGSNTVAGRRTQSQLSKAKLTLPTISTQEEVVKFQQPVDGVRNTPLPAVREAFSDYDEQEGEEEMGTRASNKMSIHSQVSNFIDEKSVVE
ncbi:uncharacterized protein DEA37_0013807 [Paragonimus westermani]|uniref:Uncharacterized protein n=1 Tax=Paragonimus westermani TaxID=34504 RepID=A0A5J4NV98_9TREM|nr:uncharacterized protein DEA37_0013807 [Paragonimus westermani]